MQEPNIEEILSSLKKELEPVQKKINKQFRNPKFPVVLILGPPRSGTTLLLQYLSASGIFSYPSNLLARFSYAPYLGSQVQQLIFNEIFGTENNHKELFNSELGKSKGSLGVNEFYHFWRRFIPNYFPKQISNIDFLKIDFKQISQEFASIVSVFNKPFVCKGMMLQYNLQDLKENADNFVFLRIKRKPEYTMQSILLARKEYFNNINTWWSVQPKEYEELKKMDMYHQIAGQVYYTEKAICLGLSSIRNDRQFTVSYTDFCTDPKNIVTQIIEKFEIDINLSNNMLPAKFNASNNIKVSKTIFNALQKAYSHFETKEIEI